MAECERLSGGVRRTPHGVRGLKSSSILAKAEAKSGRTPHGVRGLKFVGDAGHVGGVWSHPSRGAWIEMFDDGVPVNLMKVAPLTGCVD